MQIKIFLCLVFAIGSFGAFQDNENDGFLKSCAATLKNLVGGSLYGFGENVLTSYETLVGTLTDLSNDDSEILSPVSSTLLELVELISTTTGGTPAKFLAKLGNVLSQILTSLRDIVSTLLGSIGGLADVINEILTNMEGSVTDIVKNVENSGTFKFGLSRKLSFNSLRENVQLLVATIASVADSALVSATNNGKEIAIALALILESVLMVVQGINISVGSVLLSSFQRIPATLDGLLVQLNDIIDGVINVITSLVPALAETLIDVTGTLSLTSLSDNLSNSLNVVFGTAEGITGGLLDITSTLTNSLG